MSKKNLPFLSSTNELPSNYMYTPRRKSQEASNAHILKRIQTYRDELPTLMEDKVVLVREFFLTEIVPLVIAAQTGFEDGHEILKEATGDEPESRVYAKALNEFLFEACLAKLFVFVGKYADLSSEELQYYFMLYVSKVLPGGSGDELSKAIMLKMQTLLDVQRQKEEHEGSQVRQVQADKRRPHPRLRRDIARRGL